MGPSVFVTVSMVQRKDSKPITVLQPDHISFSIPFKATIISGYLI